MKTTKRFIALLLALVMLFGLTAPELWVTRAHAAASDPLHLTVSYQNPLYVQTPADDDRIQLSVQFDAPALYSDDSVWMDDTEYYSASGAAEILRAAMTRRSDAISINVYYEYDSTDTIADELKALAHVISDIAMAHTGAPNQGDYILWQFDTWTSDINGVVEGKYAYVTYDYALSYYTTAAQEEEMDEAVRQLLQELDLPYGDNPECLRGIYDYITANVTYDYENLNDKTYTRKHTAYAALMDGTAVCQGFAVLLYRLALEMGVDCRLIAGDGGGAHGWNIAEIDGLYYNLDSTWDAGKTEYDYFLVCPDNFTDHVRYEEYDTEDFHAAYPMAQEDYDYCFHTFDDGVVTTAPTCTVEGVTTYTCTICGKTRTDSIPVIDHTYDEGVVTEEPQCDTVGIMTYTCTVCGDTYEETIPTIDHQFDDGKVNITPTCTEEGSWEYTCTVCGAFYIETTPALGHSYEAETIAATCTTDGETIYTCTACGDAYTEEIPATGHEYVDGTCTVCGQQQLAVPTIESCYSRVQTSVKVTWTADENADGYELWRTTTPDDEESWTRAKTMVGSDAHIYTNQGLTIGTTYYYKVRAFVEDDEGNRTYTDFSEMDYMPAAVVFNGPYGNSTQRVRLLWNEVGGAHGYQIWRMNEDGSYSVVKTLGDRGNELTNNMGSATAYSNDGLEAGTEYTYKMRAFMIEDGKKVFGAYSDEVTIATMPEAPVVTGTSPKATRAQLTWDAVKGAAGYQIWMAEAEDGAYKIVKSVTDGSTSYTKYDLTSGKTYYFQVRAYTEVEGKKTFGAFSDVVSIDVQ